jgi:hypothetical protein
MLFALQAGTFRELPVESRYGAHMTTIAGIPAHALLVHAIVVLAPLVALLEILCAVWPAARRRLVWLVLALAAVNLVLTPGSGCSTNEAKSVRCYRRTPTEASG